jgi:hypothetical protein
MSNQLFSPGRGCTRLAWGFNPRLACRPGMVSCPRLVPRLKMASRLGLATRLGLLERASRLGLKPQARRVSLLRSELPAEVLP